MKYEYFCMKLLCHIHKDWNRFRLNRINQKLNQNQLIENRIKKIESIVPAQIMKFK